ncbi:TlpA family protein disulfide reductase [Thalassotalea sp. PLHSN55]|uniref:TlpA family protein disulfide reductase n=1 Tax=Thalassotalea sp. PLHSN55 TaxID=3435888 RepID=UPI003F839F13
MKKLLLQLSFICLIAISPFKLLAQTELPPSFANVLAKHQGKVIYLDFWASWCVPCRRSFPWMNKMQQRYGKDGLKILSVNLDAQADLAAKFLTENPAKFDIIYDPKGKIARYFKLKGMPSSFVFNRKGEIVSAHVGFTDKKKTTYEQEIVQLLAK